MKANQELKKSRARYKEYTHRPEIKKHRLELQRRYRERNREKIRARDKEYRSRPEVKERYRELQKRYRQKKKLENDTKSIKGVRKNA